MSKAQPKYALITHTQIWKLFYSSYLSLAIAKIQKSIQMQFTIYKPRSIAEQMPALALTSHHLSK
jgi:hypothetical protein